MDSQAQKQTYGDQRKIEESDKLVFGISVYKLSYIKQIKQHSPTVQHRNYIKNPVINHNGK